MQFKLYQVYVVLLMALEELFSLSEHCKTLYQATYVLQTKKLQQNTLKYGTAKALMLQRAVKQI